MPKSIEHREAEAMPKPTIRLEFFRHDEKANPAEGQPEPDVRLTSAGRTHATEIGKSRSPQPGVAVAYGSPRRRSQETAIRNVLANEPAIMPESALEEIEAMIAQEQKVGQKIASTKLLDFGGSGPVWDQYLDHFRKQKDSMRWLMTASDQAAEEHLDTGTTVYSRAAGNVAELTQRYVSALPRWGQIATENPDRYAQFGNELQRFLGSHAGYVECFLLKLIEKTEGRDAAERFISGRGANSNSFEVSEGYSITVQEVDGKPQISVRFQDRQWEVGPEVIDEMVAERDALNARIAKKREKMTG